MFNTSAYLHICHSIPLIEDATSFAQIVSSWTYLLSKTSSTSSLRENLFIDSKDFELMDELIAYFVDDVVKTIVSNIMWG